MRRRALIASEVATVVALCAWLTVPGTETLAAFVFALLFEMALDAWIFTTQHHQEGQTQ